MNVVIIGGTSGLGLALAKRFRMRGADVLVTGRTDPVAEGILYRRLDLSLSELPNRIKEFIDGLRKVDVLIYAAGYYQEGRVTDLSEEQIEEMLNVGGRGLIYGLRALLQKQAALPELITITSTSQYTPRQLEPIYNYVKAGAGHLSNAMAEDGRVSKVLVAAPAGMQTAFWKATPERDMTGMLDPEWVADEIMKARGEDYRYKYIRILRQPPRVEEVEER